MKKVFFSLLFLTSLYAEIDERKTDVYFANGIDTSEDQAIKAKNTLHDEIEINHP